VNERLNLWDFDDTLVASAVVVDRLAKAHPEIPYSDWWREVGPATLALRETKPLRTMWRTLAKTPGTNVLFSGRVLAAVETWLAANASDPDVAPGVRSLTGLIPVAEFRRPGERIPDVKLRLIRALARDSDVHLYDDHADLPALAATARIPGLTLHPVAHGRLINGRGSCGCGGHDADT